MNILRNKYLFKNFSTIALIFYYLIMFIFYNIYKKLFSFEFIFNFNCFSFSICIVLLTFIFKVNN